MLGSGNIHSWSVEKVFFSSPLSYVSCCYNKMPKKKPCKGGTGWFWFTVWGQTVHHGGKVLQWEWKDPPTHTHCLCSQESESKQTAGAAYHLTVSVQAHEPVGTCHIQTTALFVQEWSSDPTLRTDCTLVFKIIDKGNSILKVKIYSPSQIRILAFSDKHAYPISKHLFLC